MNDPNNYLQTFFTFNNPFFFALIISALLLGLLLMIYVKVIFPLQKKMILESQRYITEKAELMGLFAEMDPDPLIRINAEGKIIHTNYRAQEIFVEIDKSEIFLDELVSLFQKHIEKGELDFVEKIRDKIYSIKIKQNKRLSFANIYMHDVTLIKNYELMQEVNRQRLKLLSEKLDYDMEELKNGLSAELHDDIGQRLVMTKLKLSDPLNISCKEIDADLDVIYNRIRSISRSLRPGDIGNLGLRLSLESLIEGVSKNSGIANVFDFEGEEDGIDKGLLTCIYRIVQESITNIVKHAKATEFSVQITINYEVVDLIITDNGCGIPKAYFEYSNSKIFGTGIFSIKERIEKYNGQIHIESNLGIGTHIFIEIPWGINDTKEN